MVTRRQAGKISQTVTGFCFITVKSNAGPASSLLMARLSRNRVCVSPVDRIECSSRFSGLMEPKCAALWPISSQIVIDPRRDHAGIGLAIVLEGAPKIMSRKAASGCAAARAHRHRCRPE